MGKMTYKQLHEVDRDLIYIKEGQRVYNTERGHHKTTDSPLIPPFLCGIVPLMTMSSTVIGA